MYVREYEHNKRKARRDFIKALIFGAGVMLALHTCGRSCMEKNHKPERNLEEITELEYEEAFENNIENIQGQYQLLINSYNQYQRDKKRYKIRYFYKDGVMSYTKEKKPKMGFRTREVT